MCALRGKDGPMSETTENVHLNDEKPHTALSVTCLPSHQRKHLVRIMLWRTVLVF
jgi:hypothetical protein